MSWHRDRPRLPMIARVAPFALLLLSQAALASPVPAPKRTPAAVTVAPKPPAAEGTPRPAEATVEAASKPFDPWRPLPCGGSKKRLNC